MKTLTVNLHDTSYSVLVGPGLLKRAGDLFSRIGLSHAPILVSNSTVLRLHGKDLLESIGHLKGDAKIIRIGDGERFKSHTTLLSIYDSMFRAHADRRSWILAFGGGVIGDISGYAAATFMRGIPFVNLPTTLLAQVDSAIGGKVGINLPQGKNLVGAFHQPRAVLSDTDVLKTLSGRELCAGLYEVIKCGAIRSVNLLDYLEKHLDGILDRQPVPLQTIVFEASRIKADIVALDEKESGLRMVLNFGHTVGHALEAATQYRRFRHGEAIAWGMIAALGIGMELGELGEDHARRLTALIHRVQRLPSLKNIETRSVWDALLRDKKFRSGKIRMILLPRLGETRIHSDIDPIFFKNYLKHFLESSGNIL